jgi:hypothetical protein
MTMNPDFGGITRPHGSRRIKEQIKVLVAAEEVRDIDTTGKLADIVERTPPIGEPPRE